MTTENTYKNDIGVILLAAGESSRLGHPKQLLLHGNSILLQHALHIARSSAAHWIIVVLGAHADTIKKEIDGVETHIVVNAYWQEGMASSIRSGLETLIGIDPTAEGAILMVCDQPYVTSALLNNLIRTHEETGKHIVACSYENTFGPPVFFHKTLFPELLQLKGDVGARGLIHQHPNESETVLFPEGNIDIDTDVDYKNFQKQQ